MATKKTKLNPESMGEVTVENKKPWFEEINMVEPEVEAKEEVVKPWWVKIPKAVPGPEHESSGKKPWQE
jgi:hypothetical protein